MAYVRTVDSHIVLAGKPTALTPEEATARADKANADAKAMDLQIRYEVADD